MTNIVSISVPSAPPTHVNIHNVTSFTITVQWAPVDCIHHNGNITGFSVRYGEHVSVTKQIVNVLEDATTLNVLGGTATEVTIIGLSAATNYSIEVAAVNNAGTGVYSAIIYAFTKGTQSK